MSKVIEDGLKHFRAKAARYRKLAEKAEAEVARLEALLQERQPTQRALDARPAACNCASWFLDGTHHTECRYVTARQ